MNTDEAKKILLTTPLKPIVREALKVLLPDLMNYYDLPGEEWRNVTGDAIEFHNDYQVSNFGRIKSFKCGKVTILKPNSDGNGYLCIQFKKGNNEKQFKVHRLVAQAFIPNPDNKLEVNHRDKSGDKRNNCVENLEWATRSENMQHAYDTGLCKKGCENWQAKLTAEQVREIRRDCVPFNRKCGFTEFAKKFNVSANVIRLAYYRETYKDVE